MAKRANGSTQSKGKKHRKFDRNKDYCTQYKTMGLQLKNKLRRMRRHLKAHPKDTQTAVKLACCS